MKPETTFEVVEGWGCLENVSPWDKQAWPNFWDFALTEGFTDGWNDVREYFMSILGWLCWMDVNPSLYSPPKVTRLVNKVHSIWINNY